MQINLNRQIKNLNFPDGMMINGKILPTVASNNLTVALKTLAGNDATAKDPIYVKIGGVVYTITSAKSATFSAGFNAFNLGSNELAAKEQDFFAYLCVKTADSSIQIGFARIPYANLGSDFSTTATNEKYGRVSDGTFDMDVVTGVVNIGRFAATLGAGASYNWSVPTYTQSNLIQAPIFETRWLSFATTQTGFAATPTTEFNKFRIMGRKCHTLIGMSGTATTGGLSFTLPFSMGHYRQANTFTGSYNVGAAESTGLAFGNDSVSTTKILGFTAAGAALPTSASLALGCSGDYEI